jgi:hypothetical protein
MIRSFKIWQRDSAGERLPEPKMEHGLLTMKVFLFACAVIAAVAGEILSEDLEEERSADRAYRFQQLATAESARPEHVDQRPDGSVLLTYIISVRPRQALGSSTAYVPPCVEPEPDESSVTRITAVGAGLSAVALAGGRLGEALQPFLEAGAKVAAPEVARRLADQTVAACRSIHMVMPSEFWGFDVVDFRAYVRGRSTPLQECKLREQQRECHELQTLWTFPLNFLGGSVDPREDARWGPLASRRPILVNFAPERREGLLVLELKRAQDFSH